jgi:MoaE-MoaD fusion protein
LDFLLSLTIQIRLFARFREVLGRDMIRLSLPFPERVDEIRKRLQTEYPELTALIDRSAIAINGEYAQNDQMIQEKDEVALIPPVSGGSNKDIGE